MSLPLKASERSRATENAELHGHRDSHQNCWDCGLTSRDWTTRDQVAKADMSARHQTLNDVLNVLFTSVRLSQVDFIRALDNFLCIVHRSRDVQFRDFSCTSVARSPADR